MKQTLLIQQKKGYSFRLLDITSKERYRALIKEFPTLAVGALLLVEDLKLTGDLIEEMSIIFTIKGDSKKSPVDMLASDAKLGLLVDGVPILNIGMPFYAGKEKRAYAYFSNQKTTRI